MRPDHHTFERKGDEEADPVSIVTKSLETLQQTMDDKLKAVEAKADTSKLADRLDKLEAKASRPTGGSETKAEAAEELKAWVTYLRKGPQTDDVSLKALTVASDTQAGYLAPAEVSKEFIRELIEISPIRQFAGVRTSLAPSVKYPKRTGITNAKWEGEIEESEESTLTFGQAEIISRRLTT